MPFALFTIMIGWMDGFAALPELPRSNNKTSMKKKYLSPTKSSGSLAVKKRGAGHNETVVCIS